MIFNLIYIVIYKIMFIMNNSELHRNDETLINENSQNDIIFNPNKIKDYIDLSIYGLFIISEVLPFVSHISPNGHFHAMILGIKKAFYMFKGYRNV